MAQCSGCKSELAVHEHWCRKCGARVRRTQSKLLSSSVSDRELTQAQFCHLLALPGMLFMGLFIFPAIAFLGLWGLLPVNLCIPFLYWLLSLKSRFVRGHAAKSLKFQLLWMLAIYAVWLVPLSVESTPDALWILAHVVVLLGGMTLVWTASNDAANGGPGKYLVRVPRLRKASDE